MCVCMHVYIRGVHVCVYVPGVCVCTRVCVCGGVCTRVCVGGCVCVSDVGACMYQGYVFVCVAVCICVYIRGGGGGYGLVCACLLMPVYLCAGYGVGCSILCGGCGVLCVTLLMHPLFSHTCGPEWG